MRFGQTALLGGLSLLLAGPTQAGGWNESCDWFQNAVVGTRCAQSWSFGVSTQYDQYGYARSATGLNGTDEHYYTTGTFAVTPTNWLTLSLGSQAVSGDHNWTYKGTAYSSSSSYAGSQTLQANVNLADTGPGAQRFVINAYFGGFVVPSHDNTGENNAVFGGFAAREQWRLGSSMSIIGEAQLQANSQSLNSDVTLFPHARLLLSNDALGIAVGPVFNSGYLLSSDQTNSQTSYYYLGGTAIAQPFRSSQSAFLNGIILQVTGQETIGQTGWVSPSYAKTNEFDVSGSVGFHFRY